MVDFSESFSELLATYAGLGTYDGEGQYYRGEECLACVKDLIRALREDNSQCEIRRHLGRAGILKKDLLHILVGSGDDPTLRNDVIRLLVNLTQPAYMCFGNAYPQGKESDLMKCFMEVNAHLRNYKEAFTTEEPMGVLGSVLAELCQKEWEEREDEDVVVIERILLLIRNLLHVSSDPQEEKRTEDDVNIHDQMIWNLHVNGLDELLLSLGNNPDESQWCMHVLEIFFLLFKEQNASTLANTGKGRSRQEKRRDEEMIEEVLAKEKAAKKRAQLVRGSRHSSFGGTFVITNQKSISGRDRVYHRSIAGLNNNSYDAEKRPRRTNKRRRPVMDLPKERVSTYSIREVLKKLCIDFLECCYNPLMKEVKENIMRRKAMDNDETYYLWCLRFFMEFNRVHDFRVDIVGETLQLPTLHYIITLTANYYESMIVEKRSVINARQWAQRLHYVMECYKEILLYIQQMSQSRDEGLCESAKVIMSNVFYHAEYRDIFVTLLRNHYEVFQTRSYLRDVVEGAHVYIKMMEAYSRQNKHMVVQEKRKGGGAKKGGRGRGKKGGGNKVLSEDQLIDLWETIDARVEELMEGVEPLPISRAPFDASSRFSVEEQKIGVMGRIRMSLINAEHPEAVSLLRAARRVWPGAEFGSHDISVDDEMEVMREILFNPAAALPVTHLLGGEGEEGDSEGEGEEGGGAAEGTSSSTVEMEFSLKSYLSRFANNKIVRVYCLLLRDHAHNSDLINHVIAKMLYRIAFQLDMLPLLYQISVFKTFQSILEQPPVPRMKELQKLSTHVVRGFFRMAASNPLMFLELLFWKTSKDCYELQMGYGTLEREKEIVKKSAVWSREQEEELATLYQRYKDEEDVVGCLEAALEGSEVKRTRRQISNQLVKQNLVLDRKQLHRKRTLKKKGEWSEEELEELRGVFAELKQSVDMSELVKSVASRFPHRRIADVTNQLREEGLLSLPQKRGSGGGRGMTDEEEDERRYKSAKYVNSSDDDSDSDSRTRHEEGPSPSGRSQQKAVHSDGGSGRESDSGQKSHGGRSGSGRVRVAACVRELYGLGYGEELQWLEAYLADEARDRTLDAEWEEMSIVAVSERVSKALSTQHFQQLLSDLGFLPPFGQEKCWRIPSSMSPDQITAAVNSLKPIDISLLPSQIGHTDSFNSSRSHEHFSGHVTSIRLHDHPSDHVTSDSDSDDGVNGELSRADALKQLQRARNQAPQNLGGQEQNHVKVVRSRPSPNSSKDRNCISKRPRLAHLSEFLESDESNDDDFDGAVPSGLKPMDLEPASDHGHQGRSAGRRRQIIDSDDEEDADVSRLLGYSVVTNGSSYDNGCMGVVSSSDDEEEHRLVICQNGTE